VPLLDGGECARRAAWPVRPPAGMPEGRDSHRGRGAAGKNNLVTGKRAGALPDLTQSRGVRPDHAQSHHGSCSLLSAMVSLNCDPS
jgi:hypothetical protein